MNSIVISGRLTSDPKFFPEKLGKNALTSFSLANNTRLADKTDRTLFMQCVQYGDEAAKTSKMLYSGVEVLVSGKLIPYKDDYGNSGVKILVSTVEIMRHTKKHLEEYGVSKKDELRSSGFEFAHDVSVFDTPEFDGSFPWE